MSRISQYPHEITEIVLKVQELLSIGDFSEVERITTGRRMSAEDLREVVSEYPDRIAPIPSGRLGTIHVFEADPEPHEATPHVVPKKAYLVDAPLWSTDNEESDLFLTLLVSFLDANEFDIVLRDLRVW